jgi:hypothetical protein
MQWCEIILKLVPTLTTVFQNCQRPAMAAAEAIAEQNAEQAAQPSAS